VATVTGWKMSDVEELRLPDLMALTDWWREHPPMAYAGKGEGSERTAPGVPPEDEVLDDDGLVGILAGKQ
jgi:hypothetical protein